MTSNLVSIYIACRPDNCWISKLLRREEKISIKVIEHLVPGRLEHPQLFTIVAGNKANLVSSLLQRERAFKQLKIIRCKGGYLLGYAKTLCNDCGLELAEDCIVRSVSSTRDGGVLWHVIGYDNAVRNFMNQLLKKGVSFKIVRQQMARWNGILTARQEMVLKIALENGYFDYPRKADTRTLAAQLGISPSTFSETLRKGLKKVVMEYMTLVGVM